MDPVTTSEPFYEYYEYEDDPCYKEPNQNCLNSLPMRQDEIDEIWSSQSDEDKFDCLYGEWRSIDMTFAEANVTDKNFMRTFLDNICLPRYEANNCWYWMGDGMSQSQKCPLMPSIFLPEANVTRTCDAGIWGAMDYSECLSPNGTKHLIEICSKGHSDEYDIGCGLVGITPPSTTGINETLALVQRDIYFFGSLASLLLLTVALIIFCGFKALQCPRVHIHKNLVISLMIQCILNIVIFEPYVLLEVSPSADIEKLAQRTTYIEHPWLCKAIFTLSNYVTMTNLFWGFVEGLFLISRISIAVFSRSTPYWLFYSIGWGIPAIFAIAWAISMHYVHEDKNCWRDFAANPYFMLIMVPTVAVALINAIFLCCIIRILITKLHAVNTDEHVQIRKAMKAAVVLLPLLSITSLLFIWAPKLEASPKAHAAYRITNASLHVAQGILVSVIFCFFNGEVRSAMVNFWKQWRSETFRYRSSRASSVCVTQSEHMVTLGGSQIRRMSHTSHLSSAEPAAGGTAV